MDIKTTLKIAIAALAISGLTVACTNDDNPAPAQAAVKESKKTKPEAKKEVDNSAEEKAKLNEERMEAIATLDGKLKEMVNNRMECENTKEIIEASRATQKILGTKIAPIEVDGKVEYGDNSVLSIQAGVIRFINEMDKFSLECRMDAIGSVADSLRRTYLNNQALDHMTYEEATAGYDKASAYVGAIADKYRATKAHIAVLEYNDNLDSINAQTEKQLNYAANSISIMKKKIADSDNKVLAGPVFPLAGYVKLIEKAEQALEDIEAMRNKDGSIAVANSKLRMAKEWNQRVKGYTLNVDYATKRVQDRAQDDAGKPNL